MGSRVPNFKVSFKSVFPPSARELQQSQNQVESIKTSMKSQWDEKAKKFVVVPFFLGLMGIALSFTVSVSKTGGRPVFCGYIQMWYHSAQNLQLLHPIIWPLFSNVFIDGIGTG